ncbi:MAG: 50S ribosomal protein L25/general stress protein Ctc [Gammaproteobacteria bacterium]
MSHNHTYEIEAQVRADAGRGASRRLRHEGRIPAIVYGADVAAVSLTLEHKEVMKHLEHEGFYSHILALKINGKKEDVVLKDVQRHPFKPRVLHMDFLRVKANEPILLHVPLHFVGETDSPAAKNGGVFTHVMMNVEVKCLPRDLPEFIEVNVSGLEIDKAIHLSELKLPKGVTIPELDLGEAHDRPVVSAHEVREAKEDLEAEAAEEALKAAEHEAYLKEHPEAAAPGTAAPAAEGETKEEGK